MRRREGERSLFHARTGEREERVIAFPERVQAREDRHEGIAERDLFHALRRSRKEGEHRAFLSFEREREFFQINREDEFGPRSDTERKRIRKSKRKSCFDHLRTRRSSISHV